MLLTIFITTSKIPSTHIFTFLTCSLSDLNAIPKKIAKITTAIIFPCDNASNGFFMSDLMESLTECVSSELNIDWDSLPSNTT